MRPRYWDPFTCPLMAGPLPFPGNGNSIATSFGPAKLVVEISDYGISKAAGRSNQQQCSFAGEENFILPLASVWECTAILTGSSRLIFGSLRRRVRTRELPTRFTMRGSACATMAPMISYFCSTVPTLSFCCRKIGAC